MGNGGRFLPMFQMEGKKNFFSGLSKIKAEIGYSLFWQGRLGLAMGNTELSGLKNLLHSFLVELF